MIPHHVVTGPEDAPVLVLSNSLGTTLDMWEPQLALADAFRLVRYDTRGHGGSPAPDGDYELADLGGDVIELLDHLGVEQAHFAGISLGGMVGMWLGTYARDRVDRLVLISTSSRLGPPEGWRDRARTVRAQGTGAIVDATLERWLSAEFRRREPATVARIKAMFEGIDDEGYARCCGAIERMNLTPTLPGILAPTLVIAATDDPATPPQHARIIANAIPGARLEILEPGRHLLNIERADEVTALIREHLG
jgi:3-oxoadipate enol-lactonase